MLSNLTGRLPRRKAPAGSDSGRWSEHGRSQGWAAAATAGAAAAAAATAAVAVAASASAPCAGPARWTRLPPSGAAVAAALEGVRAVGLWP